MLQPNQQRTKRALDYALKLGDRGVARQVSRQGFIQLGRGAIVVIGFGGRFFYVKRDGLNQWLEGERLRQCLLAVDGYDPLTFCVMTVLQTYFEKGEPSTQIDTFLIKLSNEPSIQSD